MLKGKHRPPTASQAKTFLAWIQLNVNEVDGSLAVERLGDLQDGVVLGKLLQALTKETLSFPLKSGGNKLQALSTLQQVLDFAELHGVRITCSPYDIYEGRENMILGLIWILILKFQVKNKEGLLRWLQTTLEGNPFGISVSNFGDSWVDGKAFCCIVSKLAPYSIDLSAIPTDNPEMCCAIAFEAATDYLNIPTMLDAADAERGGFEERGLVTYLSLLQRMPIPHDIPPVVVEEKEDWKAKYEEMRCDSDSWKVKYHALQTELEEQQVRSSKLSSEIQELMRERDDAIARTVDMERSSREILDRTSKDLKELVTCYEEMKEQLLHLNAESVSTEKRIQTITLRTKLLEESFLVAPISIPVGHITLAFTDVQDSTKLWESNPIAMANALSTHNNCLRRLIREFDAYEVKTEGDAFMVAFQNAVDAAQWALRVQEELLNQAWDDEILRNDSAKAEKEEGVLLYKGLRVRIGLHTGECSDQQDPVTGRTDYFGPMVNRASRVEGRAKGGQILLSGQTWDAIKNDSLITESARHRFLGEFLLRGLSSDTAIHEILPKSLALRKFPDPLSSEEEALRNQAKAAEELIALEEANSQLREKVAEMEEKAKEAEEKAATLQKWLEEQKKAFAQELSRDLEEASQEVERLTLVHQKLSHEIRNSNLRLSSSEDHVQQLQARIQTMHEFTEEIAGSVSSLRRRNLELEQRIRSFEEEKEEKQTERRREEEREASKKRSRFGILDRVIRKKKSPEGKEKDESPELHREKSPGIHEGGSPSAEKRDRRKSMYQQVTHLFRFGEDSKHETDHQKDTSFSDDSLLIPFSVMSETEEDTEGDEKSAEQDIRRKVSATRESSLQREVKGEEEDKGEAEATKTRKSVVATDILRERHSVDEQDKDREIVSTSDSHNSENIVEEIGENSYVVEENGFDTPTSKKKQQRKVIR